MITQKRRDHKAALRQEAKNLEATGKGQHRVTDPPWRRRITKVAEDTQERIARPMPTGRQEQSQVEEVHGAMGHMELANQEGPLQVGLVE